jgi:hypothetical protein
MPTGNSQVKLIWVDVSGETGYRVERSLDGTTGWSTIGLPGADDIDYLDLNLASGSKVYYRVFAVGEGGESSEGNVTSATTLTLEAPSAPSSVSVNLMNKKKTRVSWSWNGTGASGFKIQQSPDGESWTKIATVLASVRAWDPGAISPGTYYYRVAAFNAAGESAFVSAPMITIAEQTAVVSSRPVGAVFSERRIEGLE